MHGFSGATTVHDVAEDDDGRPLIILYVGDYDPSGMCMSAVDLPKRFEKYGGDHVVIKRVAVTPADFAGGLLSFPASDEEKDTRYRWFVRNYGDRCWELDAMDRRPAGQGRGGDQRAHRMGPGGADTLINEAEQASLKTVLQSWQKPAWGGSGEIFRPARKYSNRIDSRP